jgi:hypothetical protein
MYTSGEDTAAARRREKKREEDAGESKALVTKRPRPSLDPLERLFVKSPW